MTAEVAVMNKSAVALAADSAVTITHPNGNKIYYSVNKLYTLSKYHPVGIMVYGNAQFMNVPWETIIKIYRKKLGTREFDTLKEYADDFFSFLQEKDNPLFPKPVQDNHFAVLIYSYFLSIKNEIDQTIETMIESEGEINREQIDIIVAEIIRDHNLEWRDAEGLPHIKAEKIHECIVANTETIQKFKDEVFSQFDLSDESVTQLDELVHFLFTKNRFTSLHSGVVVAGFGKLNAFPSLYAYMVDLLVNGELKFSIDRQHEIDFGKEVAIMSFAQSEMVQTFLDGAGPNHMLMIYTYLANLLDNYGASVLGAIPQLGDAEREDLTQKLRQGNGKILSDFFDSVTKYQRENHSDPILFNVSNLPKDELAKMAESLVNITSFKRRVSLDAETVGGPIDVAVISKGDGFIWIKRKHYFEAQENPHFFANYFGSK